jgi:heme oxygenase
MLGRLEYETRELHAAAEADRFSVLDEPTLAGYRRFLATIYRFEYAIEAQLAYSEELPLRFFAENLRTGMLGADLRALGSDSAVTDIFARALDHPRLRDSLRAYGWLYVLQRNTLQHAAVYRALAPHLRGKLQLASRYLTAGANNVYVRWYELGAHLDGAASTPERANAIIAAAGEAFERQHAWCVEARRPMAIEMPIARPA